MQLEPYVARQDSKPSLDVFELCRSEAEAGDAESLYWVSFFYFGLLESTLDEQRGVQATSESADLGYEGAQFWMGWQSEVGGHLPQDPVVALGWYEKAAESGHWMALDRLAKAYRNGELGLEIDEVKAQEYATRQDCYNKSLNKEASKAGSG